MTETFHAVFAQSAQFRNAKQAALPTLRELRLKFPFFQCMR